MAVKTYEAPNTIVTGLTLIVGGKPRRVSFTPVTAYEGSHTGVGSMLTTGDEALQNAIEGCTLWGRSIRLFAVEREAGYARKLRGEEPEAEALGTEAEALKRGAVAETAGEAAGTVAAAGTWTPDVIVSVAEVSSLSDAREYLAERYGVDKHKVSNPAALAKVAKNMHILFEGLNL